MNFKHKIYIIALIFSMKYVIFTFEILGNKNYQEELKEDEM